MAAAKKRSFHTNCSYKTRLLHFDLNFIWQPRRVINRRIELIATANGMLIECDRTLLHISFTDGQLVHRSLLLLLFHCPIKRDHTNMEILLVSCRLSCLVSCLALLLNGNGAALSPTTLQYIYLTVIHRNHQSQPTETRVSEIVLRVPRVVAVRTYKGVNSTAPNAHMCALGSRRKKWSL